jgi:hypothetical protein
VADGLPPKLEEVDGCPCARRARCLIGRVMLVFLAVHEIDECGGEIMLERWCARRFLVVIIRLPPLIIPPHRRRDYASSARGRAVTFQRLSTEE